MRAFEDLRQDLRFATRTLTRERLFTAAAVLMLALGIGANSAMFALVDAILLRPLPFPAPDRLVVLWEQTPASPRSRVSPINLLDWKARSRTFEGMAAYVPNVAGMVLASDDGNAETVPRQWVSSGIFDVLGVRPLAGRTFLPSDDAERAAVVVLSEMFWRTRFDADPGIVGRSLRLDGDPWTVIGIVPDAAQVIGRASLWALSTPRFPPAAPPNASRAGFAHAIGRLKPGIPFETAAGDLSTVAEALARELPASNAGRGVTIEPLHGAVVGRELRLTSMLFLGVVGLVLLICCANIANLLLARATVRRRELATRAALGADRSRVIRQLLTESLVLGVVGGLVGIGIGVAILSVAPSAIPPDLLPAPVTLSFDFRVLAFCAVATLIVASLFGLAPAWQAANAPLAQVIASESRTASPRGSRTRASLAAAQVAVAVVLLFAAGLLLRTLANLDAVDRGYRAESVLTMLVDPIDQRYGSPAGLLRFYDAIEQDLRSRPGVRAAAWATTLPMGQSYFGQSFVEIAGDAPLEESARPIVDYQLVSQSYFDTLDLPIVTGRAFDERDRAETVPVCMVNEAFARRFFQGRSPIGMRLAIRPTAFPQAKPFIREIVGVARQVKGRPDETDDFLQIYVPLAQNTVGDIFLLVRPESGDAAALAPAVRATFARLDSDQLTSVRNVMTLEDVASDATARHRFRAVLVLTFAGLSLGLAMVGLFGVIAYSVEQRVRDFGVRRALGATTRDVLGVVMSGAAPMIAIGAAIGLALSLAAGRLLASLLFGVRPLDVATFTAVALVLAVTAAAAVVGPAWRAARVDPAVALRAD
jgi:putative ABC transport system permease protein